MFDFLKWLFSRQVAAPPGSIPAPLEPAAPPPAPAPPPAKIAQAGDAIALQLNDVVARLPASFAPVILSSMTGTFALAVETALAQLASGAVRVPFGDIRRGSPPGTFADNASLDETLVDLPLPKILAAIDPALLARRPGQKQVEVPADISGIFGSKGKGPARTAAPVAPTTLPVSVAPKPAPAPRMPPAPVAFPEAAPLPFVTQKPAAPALAPVPQTSPGGALMVRLSALYEFWPEPIRQEIGQANWSDATVSLPMNHLEAAMKTGRVVFPWGQLIQWLDGSSTSVSTPHRDTALELPLKVIAPLFMDQQRTPVAQKQVSVGENLPNLFAAPGKSTVRVAPAPMPVPAPVPAVVSPNPAAAALADGLGEIFGQPAKKEWSPQEITQKINSLPGVAASLIAMSDGFLVAGALPPPMKSETMAAFLPQIFGRLAHYSTEIQLGPLAALTLQAGQKPCTIFRTGALYLAVLGKPGESLPDAVLLRVAGELAKRNP
ncbi:MAG: roadblock/LC7 domain-containing protein [Verrucomicrobiota bacterium]|jgi:predicted regulator of Ras-like GTPase activity (Roadblock/LC7/MglB family)